MKKLLALIFLLPAIASAQSVPRYFGTAADGDCMVYDDATDDRWELAQCSSFDTDTNANTICSGSTTYLDGEGNCDDISSVYAAASHAHAASDITSGTLAHERGGLETDASAADGLARISGGSTSFVNSLAGLNTALGSSIADGAHTTDTNANTICTGTTTYLDGEGNCDDLSGFSNFGSSVDDTEMTAEDFGEFTCDAMEDGCTLDAESQTLEEASDVTLSSLGTGDVLLRIGSAWNNRDLLAPTSDTDTTTRSTTGAAAAITGLSVAPTVDTRNHVFVIAQLSISAAGATTNCTFYINENLDGADTNISGNLPYYYAWNGTYDQGSTAGDIQTITVFGFSNVGASGTATYTVYWAEASTGTCYSDNKMIAAYVLLDE